LVLLNSKKKMASVGLGTGSASVTSMNYVGFEELKGRGAPELLYNQIFIEPNQPQATSSGNIAAAGYVPGQQSYLKQRRTIWSKSRIARDLELQGFTRVYGVGS
jgi:hypothetical protein